MNSVGEGDLLIGKLVQRYAAISTYRDRGVVLQPLLDGEPPTETKFESCFRRPGLFRFSFSIPHPYPPLAHKVISHCCGVDAAGAYSWKKGYDGQIHMAEEANLSMAVAGATGISGGSAHTIGGLLMPDIGGSTFGDIRGASVLGYEIFDGAECTVVDAPHPSGGQLTLWVQHDTMILRKLVTKLPDFPPGEEVRRDIEIDRNIEDDELERPLET